MSAIAPVAASSFAPEERPQQVPATAAQPRRTGRHEPIRSSTARIAARGAVLGLTMAAGSPRAPTTWSTTRSSPCWPAPRWARSPTARPTTRPRPGSWPSAAPTGSPSPRPPGQAAGNPDAGRALGLPGRVAVLRALL